MAKLRIDGLDVAEQQVLKGLDRGQIRQIVEAGAAAAVKRMDENARARSHVRTGDMVAAIRGGEYRETMDGGAINVYPQDYDRKGVGNALKAFVINYGRGGTRRKGKMGDKFITGDEARAEELVTQAMQAEADRLLADA